MVPDFLTELPRWILWREVSKSGRLTKLPYGVRGGQVSDVTDPENWGTYSFCVGARQRASGAWDGEGIVLGDYGEGEVLVGLDLDSCLHDGALAEWARPYLAILTTYAEISPSGRGLKLFFRAKSRDLPEIRLMFGIPADMNGRKKTYANGSGEAHGPAAEIYLSHRYFTVTGQQWPESPDEVAIVDRSAFQLVANMFGPRDAGVAGNDAIIDASSPDPLALRAKIAEAVSRRPQLAERWMGLTTGLADASRSGFDMSLGAMLKAAGFSYGEMRAALTANPHGAGAARSEDADDRYFERIWIRSVVTVRQSEEPPAWIDAGPAWDSIDGEAEDATIPPPDEKLPDPFPATPISLNKLNNIPPRELVYGHFLFRKFVSALGAPGGSGKTAYAYTIALAVAAAQDFLSEGVFDPGNVWIYNLEDPETELYRRLKAAMIGHNVTFEDIEGKLFMDSGRDRPLVIAMAQRDGSVIAWPQVPALIAEIKARGVHLLIVDPFVRSHRVEENHNDQIDFVAALWASIADAADCAILLVHHFRKGGASGDAGAFRGASALIDASRAAVTLATMVPEEASRLGVLEKDRWQYVRVDNAKLNLAPPPDDALWLKLSGVDLDNATDTRQADNVQTVQRWKPESPWVGITWPDTVAILNQVEKGPSPGEFYALGKQSKDRWAGQILIAKCDKTEGQAIQILKTWADNGLIEEGQYLSPNLRRTSACVRVNLALFSQMRRANEDRNQSHD